MKKFTNLERVDLGLVPLNSELVYLTENKEQRGSLVLVFEDNGAKVFSLHVLLECRGKGYGKKLMQKAIMRCVEKNCQWIELNTEVDNVAANSLYESLGFQLKGIKFGFNNWFLNLQ